MGMIYHPARISENEKNEPQKSASGEPDFTRQLLRPMHELI
jgi:hypothetical protein